jgi:hypothetical protein
MLGPYLNYILGFRRFGLDILYVEYIRNEHCVDENGKIGSVLYLQQRRVFPASYG